MFFKKKVSQNKLTATRLDEKENFLFAELLQYYNSLGMGKVSSYSLAKDLLSKAINERVNKENRKGFKSEKNYKMKPFINKEIEIVE